MHLVFLTVSHWEGLSSQFLLLLVLATLGWQQPQLTFPYSRPVLYVLTHLLILFLVHASLGVAEGLLQGRLIGCAIPGSPQGGLWLESWPACLDFLQLSMVA